MRFGINSVDIMQNEIPHQLNRHLLFASMREFILFH